MAAAPLPKMSLTIRPLPRWLARPLPNEAKASFGTRQHAAAAACVWLQYAHDSVDSQPTCGGPQGANVGCWILSTRSPYAITAMGDGTSHDKPTRDPHKGLSAL